MAYYDIESRKTLGRVIGRSRRAAGYADTDKWASEVGRSTRTVLGIERGDSAGPKTYARIEELLGWYTGACYEFLDGVDPEQAISSKAVGGDTQDEPQYVESPGERATEGMSDDDVLRRLEQMQEDIGVMLEWVARRKRESGS